MDLLKGGGGLAYLFIFYMIFRLRILVFPLLARILADGHCFLLTRLVLLVFAIFCVLAAVNWVFFMDGGLLSGFVGQVAWGWLVVLYQAISRK
ncbi:MAG: hypothetical protein AB2558_21425 [Candidatus Thiodiazotropha sp.]